MSGVTTATIIAGVGAAVSAVGVGYSLLSPKGGGGGSAPPPGQQPNAPGYTDPSIQAAADRERAAAANAAGRQSTIATSGQGDTSASTTQKKTLLGVG